MGRRRRQGVMASGSSGCFSRSRAGWRRRGRGEVWLRKRGCLCCEACVFALFCAVCSCFFVLGSRRRVAVGGVGDGETESISLGL
jgi:hypothetical protein